jgi:hypothetical protein
VTSDRRKPDIRDHNPTYVAGAYWACSPPICSNTRGMDAVERFSNICLASNARFNCPVVKTVTKACGP